jgi:hypothetical protein
LEALEHQPEQFPKTPEKEVQVELQFLILSLVPAEEAEAVTFAQRFLEIMALMVAPEAAEEDMNQTQ